MGELLEGERLRSLPLQIAPLVNPLAPTFYITGETDLIEGDWLDGILHETFAHVDTFRIDAQVISRDGQLEGSKLAAQLKECSFALGNRVHTMKQLQFSVPLEGSVSAPVVDVSRALQDAISLHTSSFLTSLAGDFLEEITQIDEPVKAVVDEVVDFFEEPSKELQKEAAKWVSEGLKQFDKLFQER